MFHMHCSLRLHNDLGAEGGAVVSTFLEELGEQRVELEPCRGGAAHTPQPGSCPQAKAAQLTALSPCPHPHPTRRRREQGAGSLGARGSAQGRADCGDGLPVCSSLLK